MEGYRKQANQSRVKETGDNNGSKERFEGRIQEAGLTLHFFCPACFRGVPRAHGNCPDCGEDMDAWNASRSYTERLIHALAHPLAEVRMRSIIALGKRKDEASITMLERCAFRHPADIIQAMEIIRALENMPSSSAKTQALDALAEHPAHAIRKAVGRVPRK